MFPDEGGLAEQRCLGVRREVLWLIRSDQSRQPIKNSLAVNIFFLNKQYFHFQVFLIKLD